MPRFDFIVTGGDTGTDGEAFAWAMVREVPALVVPAKWRTGTLGKREGPERNRLMLRWGRPIVVLGFAPGGRGTSGMMELACLAGLPAWWWFPKDECWILDVRCEP